MKKIPIDNKDAMLDHVGCVLATVMTRNYDENVTKSCLFYLVYALTPYFKKNRPENRDLWNHVESSLDRLSRHEMAKCGCSFHKAEDNPFNNCHHCMKNATYQSHIQFYCDEHAQYHNYKEFDGSDLVKMENQ